MYYFREIFGGGAARSSCRSWQEKYSLRSWRYCVGARLKFWRRRRVPKKGSNLTRLYYNRSAAKSHSTILQRLRRQISLDYYTIPPATQAKKNRARRYSYRWLRRRQNFPGIAQGAARRLCDNAGELLFSSVIFICIG